MENNQHLDTSRKYGKNGNNVISDGFTSNPVPGIIKEKNKKAEAMKNAPDELLALAIRDAILKDKEK